MHVLFVHQNFPAQFGPFAFRLAKSPGHSATFVTQKLEGDYRGVRCIKYGTRGGAVEATHFCSRTFENAVWHASGIHDALAALPDIRPDLIVGHSGFGSTLYLRDLYPGVPIINLFEYFYRVSGADLDFRPDFPARPVDRLRARTRNAMILLDLDNCDLGYCPTEWQRSRMPNEFDAKLRTLFDGVDTALWKPDATAPRIIAGRPLAPGTKIVTYVARGMEAMRGFDLFMRMAKKVADRRKDVLFVVVGSDRVCYGGDERFTGGKTFKEWVLAQGDYDLSRFLFTGLLTEADLAKLFAITNLHVYFTVPFVLSWSMLNAMSCGAVVLGSDTPPVREVIEPGRTGLLEPFFDVDAFAETALKVLADPASYAPLGAAAAGLVREKYSLDVSFPKFLRLCDDALAMPRTHR
jgi:glycosyltransferase involved in cell wall biosynthesis